MDNITQNSIEKIIPSKLEIAFQKFLYKYVGRYIPKGVTPNQITLIGAFGGFISIIFTCLTYFSSLFFIGTIIGLIIHLIADDLDGYVARTRGMLSKSGAYFDLITDVMFSTFLIIALGFSPYASLEIMIFAAPVYGIINVTAMNYIIYFNEFRFPRLGPIEAHITYAILSISSILIGRNPLFNFLNIDFMIADVIILIGLIPTYYEMVRLQVQLFKRLKEKENNE